MNRSFGEGAWSPLVLADARVRQMRARSSGQTYRISLWQPAGATPASGWPVIYVLDAGTIFAGFAETLRRASVRPRASGIAPALLVGIEAELPDEARRAARYLDYTPGPSTLEPGMGVPNGGARELLAFLEGELLPLIEREFAADPGRRGLFGHSLAGYFTLWTLVTRPGLFESHFAISPSIWWDAPGLLAALSQAGTAVRGSRVYLAAGEWEGAPAPWQEAVSADPARRERRRMIGNAQLCADRLRGVLPTGAVRFELLADEDHGSVVLPAISRALRFMQQSSVPQE